VERNVHIGKLQVSTEQSAWIDQSISIDKTPRCSCFRSTSASTHLGFCDDAVDANWLLTYLLNWRD